MIVAKKMNRRVITVTPKDTLGYALGMMTLHKIRHLPVVEEGRLIGIVSNRDLQRAAPYPLNQFEAKAHLERLEKLTLERVMKRPVITISPYAPIEEAAALMLQHKIGALPVVDEGALVGIITEIDVLEVLTAMMGASEPGSRLELEISTEPGILSEVIRVVESHDVEIASIVAIPVKKRMKRMLIIRLRTINPDPVIVSLREYGYTVVSSEFVVVRK